MVLLEVVREELVDVCEEQVKHSVDFGTQVKDDIEAVLYFVFLLLTQFYAVHEYFLDDDDYIYKLFAADKVAVPFSDHAEQFDKVIFPLVVVYFADVVLKDVNAVGLNVMVGQHQEED